MDTLPTPRRAPEPMTTAVVNGHPVEVCQVHRRWSAADYIPGAPQSPWYDPVAITVAARIGLAVEDAVAVLFNYCCPPVPHDWSGGAAVDALGNDDFVRLLVTEVVVNRGCGQLEELRCRLSEQTLTPEQATVLTYCRHRAATVLATHPHVTKVPSADSVGTAR